MAGAARGALWGGAAFGCVSYSSPSFARSLALAAARVTRAGLSDPARPAQDIDLATEMVAMTLASYDFKASAKVVEAGREMSKSLLDILA